MSDGEFTVSMSMPLDSDGFLRRQCATCSREFKWVSSENADVGEAVPEPDGGYFCPYCGIQSDGDWLTEAQAELAMNLVQREVVGPLLDDFTRSVNRAGSGGLIGIEASASPSPAPLGELTEPDDMVRFDFPCHPSEPVKVLEDWSGRVGCLCCGADGRRA